MQACVLCCSLPRCVICAINIFAGLAMVYETVAPTQSTDRECAQLTLCNGMNEYESKSVLVQLGLGTGSQLVVSNHCLSN
jgi:hypothetical protein